MRKTILPVLLAIAGCTKGDDSCPPAGTLQTPFRRARAFNQGVASLALAVDGSRDLYVGGGFTSYERTESGRIIRLDDGGAADAAFAVGAGFNAGGIPALAPATDGSGDLYAGGNFTAYNGTPANRIARLNPDATLDAGFAIGTAFNAAVSALAVALDGSGDVHAGGAFTSYDGTPINRMVRLNPDGTIDGTFAVGTGFNSTVLVILPANDGSGDLYVGGSFTMYNGTPVNRIVRLDSDGTLDAGFAVGTGFDGLVQSLAFARDASGDVYVGGAFASYDGAAVNRLVRLDSDGTRDAAFAVGSGFDSDVSGLAPATDGSGDIYVGGAFTLYNGAPRNRIARLDSDGTLDAGFAIGTGFNNTATRVLMTADGSGDLYAAGNFTSYNGTARNSIVRLRPAGTTDDAAFPVGAGFNNAVQALAPATDGSGDLYAGGDFTFYDGAAVNRIARLNSDGTLDAAFAAGTGFNGVVQALSPAADGSGDLYAGGAFTLFNAAPVNRLARLNPDGSRDAAFSVGTGCNGTVRALAPAADGSGDLYVGGNFTLYNGTAVNRMARLDSDGSLDAGFAVGTGFDLDVFAIVPAADGSGDLYVGGNFTLYDGTAVNRIVRLDSDGTLDAGFAVGTGFNSFVFRLAVAADGSGDLYAGGAFTMYDGTPASRIVRLDSDGSLDAGFAVGTGFNLDVNALTPASDGSGDVTVGGAFLAYNGSPANRMVRLNSDGSVDPGFAVGAGFDTSVLVSAAAADGSGKIHAGGFFTSYAGATVDRIIRLRPDGTLE